MGTLAPFGAVARGTTGPAEEGTSEEVAEEGRVKETVRLVGIGFLYKLPMDLQLRQRAWLPLELLGGPRLALL